MRIFLNGLKNKEKKKKNEKEKNNKKPKKDIINDKNKINHILSEIEDLPLYPERKFILNKN